MQKLKPTTMFIVTAIIIVTVPLLFVFTIDRYEETILHKKEELDTLQKRVSYLEREKERQKKTVQKLEEKTRHWEEKFENIFTVSATKYAPLSSNAVEGMCYEGDPSITASGRTIDLSKSVAMDSSIPFGTEILVEGYGHRIVHDRGGAIGPGKLDIAVHSRTEAFRFGRQNLKVLILE